MTRVPPGTLAAVIAAMLAGALPAAAQSPALPMPPGQAAPAPAAPTPATPTPATPAPAAPTPAASAATATKTVKAGVLELTPTRTAMRLQSARNRTCILATPRFQVKNTGSSDLRIALLLPTITAVDDLGINLFGDLRGVRVSGLSAAGKPEDWRKIASTEKSRITVLSPGQTVTVLLQGEQRGIPCHEDANGDFKRTHRPATYTLSASLGLLDLSDNTEIRSFSFADVPLETIAD